MSKLSLRFYPILGSLFLLDGSFYRRLTRHLLVFRAVFFREELKFGGRGWTDLIFCICILSLIDDLWIFFIFGFSWQKFVGFLTLCSFRFFLFFLHLLLKGHYLIWG